MRSRSRDIAILSLVLALSACSSLAPAKVEPWEKDELSQKIMVFEPDPLDSSFMQHLYESREASSGGYGVGGGGCGCN